MRIVGTARAPAGRPVVIDCYSVIASIMRQSGVESASELWVGRLLYICITLYVIITE